MPDQDPTGQDGLDLPEPHGDDDLAAAVGGVPDTGSHPIVESGVDPDLPDDADDILTGVPEPRPTPRVGPDEHVLPDLQRRRIPWTGQTRAHRNPPGG